MISRLRTYGNRLRSNNLTHIEHPEHPATTSLIFRVLLSEVVIALPFFSDFLIMPLDLKLSDNVHNISIYRYM
jgi:hypothetical protein